MSEQPTEAAAQATAVEMDPATMAAWQEQLAKGGGLASLQPFLTNMVSPVQRTIPRVDGQQGVRQPAPGSEATHWRASGLAQHADTDVLTVPSAAQMFPPGALPNLPNLWGGQVYAGAGGEGQAAEGEVCVLRPAGAGAERGAATGRHPDPRHRAWQPCYYSSMPCTSLWGSTLGATLPACCLS